jgi:hypothetical protein
MGNETLIYCWSICESCAHSIYATREPNATYANAVARLLYGTAMQESAGLKYDRQIGFSMYDIRGGWGWWQLESGSVSDSIARLDSSPALATNVAAWLCGPGEIAPDWYHGMTSGCVIGLTRSWPKVGVLFARLHYMRDPRPVPWYTDKQARYWKEVYNTFAGKGTPAQYIASWNRYARPVLKTLGSTETYEQ